MLLAERKAQRLLPIAPLASSVWQKSYGIRTPAETLQTSANAVFLRTIDASKSM